MPVSISRSVGASGATNLAADVMNIQILLFKTGHLQAPHYQKENTELQQLPADTLVASSQIPHTIAAIKSVQTDIMHAALPDGRVDPNGRTLFTLNSPTFWVFTDADLPAGTTPTPTPTTTPIPLNSTTPVQITTTNGELKVIIGNSTSTPDNSRVFSIASIRSYIIDNMNWNAIIKLMKLVYSKNNDQYNNPTNVTGNITDYNLLVPDQGIEYTIRLQIKKWLDTPNITLSTLLRNIGCSSQTLIKTFITQLTDQSHITFFNEGSNTSLLSTTDNTPIKVPSLQSDQATLYQFFRNLVLARNGVWSDTNQIVNIVGLRRKRASPTTTEVFDDTLAICYTDNNTQYVQTWIGSTEPGNIQHGTLASQTLTLRAGLHNVQQPAGRTSKALRKERLGNAMAWQPYDTSMNFHPGGNKFNYPSKEWLEPYGFDSDIKFGLPSATYDALTLLQINAILSEVLYILSKYGRNATAPCYQNLKNLADTTAVQVLDIQGAEILAVQLGETKRINIQRAKEWLVEFWWMRANGKNTLLSILNYLQPNLSITPDSIQSKNELLQAISDEHILQICKTQTNFYPKLSDIDGKAGPNFLECIHGIHPSIPDAKTDFQRITDLFAQFPNYNVLKPEIIQILQNRLFLHTEDARRRYKAQVFSTAAEAPIIKEDVKNWSEGCQVVYGEENFYIFWLQLLHKALASGQRFWYYTLLDASDLQVTT